MINYFFSSLDYGSVAFVGILFAFAMTCLMLSKCTRILPKDMGRAYAHDGSLSAGKPRGAGFWFVLVYVASTLIFAKMNVEILIYLILVVAAMLTGFLDDCAKSPWGEYKKGILDLIIAIMLAITFLNFNDNRIFIACADKYVTINPVVFGILIVILVWASINVTNCSDGVDGLSGTLTIITLSSVYVIDLIKGMGLFISIAVLKMGSPILYLLVAGVLIVDGGLGLIKVSLLRFLKIKILTNVRTPIHDHVRKIWNWSNTHTVYRFAIIQIVLCIAAVYLVIH